LGSYTVGMMNGNDTPTSQPAFNISPADDDFEQILFSLLLAEGCSKDLKPGELDSELLVPLLRVLYEQIQPESTEGDAQ
jgi:hypothetical protein